MNTTEEKPKNPPVKYKAQKELIKPTPDFVPLSSWNDHEAYPSVTALRNYRAQNTRDFNKRCVRSVGGRPGRGRLYLITDALKAWLLEEAAAAPSDEEEEA